jgi:uncharacterized Ntn-hydrolase superfamily protein
VRYNFSIRFKFFFILVALQSWIGVKAQDTFSILAFDSISGEVGAAGASCVDLFQAPGLSNDFITELFPGEGAVATQAAYLPSNQINARGQFMAGDSPTQILSWLQANDMGNDASVRQYGVVRMNTGYPQTAAFTGSNCMNYKNHIVGPNYTIHGNILLGQKVLDSMEARFNREQGDLACKLMAALQGANVVGADTRCAGNNSSSLFAFLKVSQPTDPFGQPTFLVSLKTHNNDSIEPIDSLQILFDAAHACTVISVGDRNFGGKTQELRIYPNPVSDHLTIKAPGNLVLKGSVKTSMGSLVMDFRAIGSIEINTKNWDKGVYFLQIESSQGLIFRRMVVSD